MTKDVTILGGGLAGLSLAIDLQKREHTVRVIEKGNYPRHKVCGEYISMESYTYLHDLCPILKTYNLPKIDKFFLSSIGPKYFRTTLDLGGFGISRYLLENLLYEEAKRIGVEMVVDTKALDVKYDSESELYTVNTRTSQFVSRIVCNSSGRKSNFEVKESNTSKSQTNYVGVKYHLKLERDSSQIEIHNFPGGYCGISNVEEGISCLCYIVNADKLKRVGNSIPSLEKTFLFQNKQLEQIFNRSTFLMTEPVTISGINFSVKEPVINGVFYLGDSAGTIAPITGNGMSMCLRSSFTLAHILDDHLCGKITKQQTIDRYRKFWLSEFQTRIYLSRHFQALSEYPLLTKVTIGVFKAFPSIANYFIKQTHGQPF